MYLAAAGIGSLGIVDGDHVEIDNLHRQIIHSERSLGRLKADSARDACLQLNSSITIMSFPVFFTSHNAMGIAANYDILVDGQSCSARPAHHAPQPPTTSPHVT